MGLIYFFIVSSLAVIFLGDCATFPAKMIVLSIFQSVCIKDMFSV